MDRVEANYKALRRSSGQLHLRHFAPIQLPQHCHHGFGIHFPLASVLGFLEHSTIKVKYVSVAHPRANSQVENANGMILDGLKKTLYDENSSLGASHTTKQSHRTVTFLPHLWVRSHTTS
jgi:hypothetical protein